MTARQNSSTRPVRTRGSAESWMGSTCRPGVVSSAQSFCRNVIALARIEPSILLASLPMMIVGISAPPLVRWWRQRRAATTFGSWDPRRASRRR